MYFPTALGALSPLLPGLCVFVLQALVRHRFVFAPSSISLSRSLALSRGSSLISFPRVLVAFSMSRFCSSLFLFFFSFLSLFLLVLSFSISSSFSLSCSFSFFCLCFCRSSFVSLSACAFSLSLDVSALFLSDLFPLSHSPSVVFAHASLSPASIFGLAPLLSPLLLPVPFSLFPAMAISLFFSAIVSSCSSSPAVLTAVVAVSIGTSIVWAIDISDGDSDMFDTRSEMIGVFGWIFLFPACSGVAGFLSDRGCCVGWVYILIGFLSLLTFVLFAFFWTFPSQVPPTLLFVPLLNLLLPSDLLPIVSSLARVPIVPMWSISFHLHPSPSPSLLECYFDCPVLGLPAAPAGSRLLHHFTAFPFPACPACRFVHPIGLWCHFP